MKYRVSKEHVLFLSLSIVFSLIVGFRGATNDTQTYFNIFKNIDNYDLLDPMLFYYETGMEIGYGWYSYIMSFFTDSSIALFGLFSFLCFFCIYKICKMMRVSYISVFLLYISSSYFFLQHFMQMRQGLAIPLAIFSITLFIYKKRLWSLFVLLIAFSLHQTAIAIWILGMSFHFAFDNKKLELRKFRWIVLFIVLFFILLSKFILIDVLNSFSGRVAVYAGTEQYGESVDLLRMPNIKAFIVFLLLLFFTTNKMIKNKMYLVLFLLFSVSVSFRIGFSDMAILSGRFSTAFSHSEIFLLPFIFNRIYGVARYFIFALYIIVQSVSVYVFQAPYIFDSYSMPLY